MAFAIDTTRLILGAAGGLSYALGEFLVVYREGFPEDRPVGRFLMEVAVRAILGAILGMATPPLGDNTSFVAGVAGPLALVALGAKFGHHKRR